MLGWLKESNRMLHLKAGFILFVACIIMQGFVISMYNIRIDFTQEQSDAVMVTMSVASFLCVFFSMCSVEYIQKAAGGRWDWLDVLAGSVAPVLLTVVIAVLTVVL
ncbi:hypothetical protein QUW56_02825 [Phocaeicola barnesiae]|uniref:hypothetical protein n=1 Tax=Phocaeicola barnesiae TaxID=376804 RepID=UPI0025A4675D|nr:hypothetical protein [Phocaeicola barnesiae]MDM8232333.1 hypothetical protein [Phocaeicola barnesiae]